MQRVWGRHNLGLYALPGGTGAGPAVWCYGLLPDYHAFRGSYGGYAFPLYDKRPRVNGSNLSVPLIASLGTAYGQPVAPEDGFDAILCLLSASSYTRRFAEDLEDVFPHVPFPARHAAFEDAVRVGREIRAIETFGREPREAYRRPGFARVVTQPSGAVAPVDYTDGGITLCADGTGRITGIPEAVWSFSVSGYRLVPR
jgi:predicted helicase